MKREAGYLAVSTLGKISDNLTLAIINFLWSNPEGIVVVLKSKYKNIKKGISNNNYFYQTYKNYQDILHIILFDNNPQVEGDKLAINIRNYLKENPEDVLTVARREWEYVDAKLTAIGY